MSERNLLITIIDTNPLWWSIISSGLVKPSSTTQGSNLNLNNISNKENFSLNDFMSAVVGFLNAYKTMNQKNAVALIASHNTKADYLYPNRVSLIDQYASPWDKYEQINDMDDQIKENLRKLTNEQIQNLNDETNNKDNLSNDSMITSAMGLALCYINRIQKKYTFADTVNYRILLIKGSDDSSNQYMNFMNMIFSAEKLNVLIDSCALLQDSSLLQQASSLTNGFYFKITQLSGLLSYLLWLFIPDLNTRKMLVYPPKVQVDFRAACFCHRKLIEVGYVCSVCLSVFCSFTPICTTCNCNFQFDMNMLKKASSLKGGNLMTKLQSQQSIGSQSNLQVDFSARHDYDLNTNRLTSQFSSASITSPADPSMMNENSNDFQTFEDDNFPASNQPSSVSTRIISAANITNRSTNNHELNDSLDMLE